VDGADLPFAAQLAGGGRLHTPAPPEVVHRPEGSHGGGWG
jgi:hypothetical protein